jgi:hypothetical protein
MIYDDLHLSICKNIEFAIQNNRKNNYSTERERKSQRGQRGSGETEE